MNMNRLRQHKFLLASLHLIPFLLLYIISVSMLSELYLFKWLQDRWYLLIWVVAAILAYRQKHVFAISLTVGGILGAPIGQFFGDFLRNRNIQSITALMSQEEQARMYLHSGVAIWIAIVILAVLIGAVLENHHKKINKH